MHLFVIKQLTIYKIKASLTPSVVMYHNFRFVKKDVQKWSLRGRTLLYSATYGNLAVLTPLKITQKRPLSPLEIDLISLLVSVEKGAFYMDPMQGSCKLDLYPSGHYETRLSNFLVI